MKVVLVTGGLGCLGAAIVELLLKKYKDIRIRILDVAQQNRAVEQSGPRVELLCGDICDPATIDRAIHGVDTVFHCAAVLNLHYFAPQSVWNVNVGGCESLIKACERAHASSNLSVRSIVYTSSHGVVFDGKPIHMGDETLPYATHFVDEYTRTKLEGEKLMRGFSGKFGILTCAFRPGGIYVPRDMFTTMRLLRIKQLHLDLMVDSSVHLDMTFVYDMAKAQILGAEKLESEHETLKNALQQNKTTAPPLTVAGSVYHIGTPAKLWNLLDDIAENVGFPRSKLSVPAQPMVWVAWFLEIIHFFFRPVVDLRQKFYFLMCPIEMVKLANPHTFSNEKARRELGYTPYASVEESVQLTAAWLRSILADEEAKRRQWNELAVPPPRVMPAISFLIIVGVAALYLAAFTPTSSTDSLFPSSISSIFQFLHTQRPLWQFVWRWVLVLLHVLEAIYGAAVWLWRGNPLRRTAQNNLRSIAWIALIGLFGGAALHPLMSDTLHLAQARQDHGKEKKQS